MSLDSSLDAPARTIATLEVATLTVDMPIEEAARLIANNGVSGMPVVDAGNALVGVVSLTDFVVLFAGQAATDARDPDESVFYDSVALGRLALSLVPSAEGAGRRVRDIMSARLLTAHPDDSVRQVARAMAAHRVHRVLLVDDDGALVGIVSALDVVSLLGE